MDLGRLSMRVALFTDSNAFAGSERHILDLARALRDQHVNVAVVCPEQTPLATKAAELGLRHLAVEKQGQVDWRAARRLAELLANHQLDIVHAHNGRTTLAATMALELARRGQVVFTQHFLKPARLNRRGVSARFATLAHQWAGHRATHIIAVSKAVREAMLERGDASPEKIVHIPNGIFPSERTDNREQIRRELGASRDDLLLLCVARLEPEKDVATLIAAMHRVIVALPRARLLIAGVGVLHAQLQEDIDRRKLTQHVSLLGFRSDVPALMSASDLFVLSSLAEPFGLVLLEAMASSRAVIATATGGPLEIVEDGITGVLVPPSREDVMATAITDLLKDETKRAKMGEEGRRRFLSLFTAETMARSTLALYRRVTKP